MMKMHFYLMKLNIKRKIMKRKTRTMTMKIKKRTNKKTMLKLKNWVIFIFTIQRKQINYLMKMKIMMKMNMKSIYFKRNPWIVRKKQKSGRCSSLRI